ncbi:MAG: glycosyltransferase family 39 protein [Elusimicrobia bacterium]|nr:glycosyltransferase family 39 protein [Elusimicrobiota bacterium]
MTQGKAEKSPSSGALNELKKFDFWTINRIVSAIMLAMGLLYAIGLFWGLPSKERARLVLGSRLEENTTFLYKQLQKARSRTYAMALPVEYIATGKIRTAPYNPNPKENLKIRGWEDPYNHLLLLAYSGFLLRSTDGDEQLHLNSLAQMKPKQFDFNPHYAIHAGIFIYGLGAVYQLAGLTKWLKLNPDIKFFYKNPQEMAKFYVVGRFYNLAWTLMGAWFLFLIARRLTDQEASAIAPFLYLAAPVVIGMGHVMKGHATGAAIALFLLYSSLRLLEEGRNPWYLISGVTAGMLMGTQPHHWHICLVVPLAHFLRGFWNNKQTWRQIISDIRLWLLPVAGIAGFIIVTPYIFTAFKEWYYLSIGAGLVHQSPTLKIWQWLRPWVIGLGLGLNHAAYFSFCLGFALFCKDFKKKSPAQRFLFIVTMFNILLFGFYCGSAAEDAATQSRRFLPLIGLCCLWSASALSWLWRRSLGKKFHGSWLAIAILIYTAGVAIFLCFNYYLDYRRASCIQAGHWINENIPKRSSIAIRSIPHTDFEPPFDFANYGLWIAASENFDPAKSELPLYAILQRNPVLSSPPIKWPQPFTDFFRYYEPVKFFGPKPRWWDFTNHFSAANVPICIFKRKI